MMEFELRDRRLNLFRHFGGSWGSENNTTRAFMIALSRSRWNVVLVRSFLDLLSRKIADCAPELGAAMSPYLGTWPTQVEIAMQEGVAKDSFLTDVKYGILVDLTPEERPDGATVDPSNAEARAQGGIVDALLVVRYQDDQSVAIVLESKLYGRAGDAQMGKYLEAMGARLGRDSCVRVRVEWDEVYRLADVVPDGGDDPILSDFKSFIDARPHLVAFRGFREEDFESTARLDTCMRRLCDRLMRDGLGDPGDGPSFTFADEPMRKRGGSDYDLKVAGADLKGNIGLGCWDGRTLRSKLVVGSRTYAETSHLFARGRWDSEEVQDMVTRLREQPTFSADGYVRLYFHRFEAPWVRVGSLGSTAGDAKSWTSFVEALRPFHESDVTPALLEDLSRLTRDKHSAIERAHEVLRKRSFRCFVALVFNLDRDGSELSRQLPNQQVATVRRDLLELALLLQTFSR